MTANVLAFPSRGLGPQPWTNDELAELYRVVEILGRAGLAVETDMGMSDEGDPWFVFCRCDSGDVIAHFARIGGQFVAASIAVDETYRGANFRQIVERMVESQPLILPPPGSGTRLLMHPVVILTAFVATALAHSEKMVSSDWLRSVEAGWDHSPSQDTSGAIKHAGKVAWFDNLQTLFKTSFGDGKLSHDGGAKEGQALTLVSLIAIAMTALQPIVEKISAISAALADDLAGSAHASPVSEAAKAAQLAQDVQLADVGTAHVDKTAAGGLSTDDNPQQHHSASDWSGDTQKTAVDLTQHSAAVAIAKPFTADDAAHPVAIWAANEAQADSSAAFVILQQKLAAASAPSLETAPSSHGDSGAAPLAITLDDVTPQAMIILGIQKTAAGAGNGDAHLGVAPNQGGNGDGNGTAAMVQQPQQAPNLHIDVANANGADVINAIANFVNSGDHMVSQSFVASANLEQQLAPYFGSSANLKVILFDGGNLATPIFAFAHGVVFVEDALVAPNTNFNNPGGDLVLDGTGGGAVALVGVAVIEQHAHA